MHMLWVLIRSASEAAWHGYSFEAPHRHTSNEYLQYVFINNKRPIKYGKKVSYLELCVC